MKIIKKIQKIINNKLYSFIYPLFFSRLYFFKRPCDVPVHSIIIFPVQDNIFCCGLAGIVSFIDSSEPVHHFNIKLLDDLLDAVNDFDLIKCFNNKYSFKQRYLGGEALIGSLKESSQNLKCNKLFADILNNNQYYNELELFSTSFEKLIDNELKFFKEKLSFLNPEDIFIISKLIEDLKDIKWCLTSEIADNIIKVKDLINKTANSYSDLTIFTYKKINSVLNSIDRLEVRGRDSAGISIMFIFDHIEFEKIREIIKKETLFDQLNNRSNEKILRNNSISLRYSSGEKGDDLVSIAFTYKIAAEIGYLGDNVSFIRQQIRNDQLLQIISEFPCIYNTVSSHTRWASVGAISEENCHPVDNITSSDKHADHKGIIHVCLNGDIDNYLELKEEYENKYDYIQKEITTDTKIIALQIEMYIKRGHNIKESFLMAVNDFEGSHAITMHTELAPGKLFLAQKGSGQAIFVGVSKSKYMIASEVYGFIEETPYYIKLDGERVIKGKGGKVQGQIFILDQRGKSETDGIEAMYYDGTLIKINKSDIKYTEITTRDIDRQNFKHYFLKEISEAPVSVEKTLLNRWKIKEGTQDKYEIQLDGKIIPLVLQTALKEEEIKRVFFIGQGTAGVAALACSNILNYYIKDSSIKITAIKASELSGFEINGKIEKQEMADTLVIAISQSGTTTDTNRAVDMVKKHGAKTLAIVNRRDSDLSFKVDGVIYTSSGRDIEMSVASTKAFYSQIVAGAILGLQIVNIKNCLSEDNISDEIGQLLNLPDQMRKIFKLKDQIEASARQCALKKTYWATVGSGPNKASADEIRIKLSELCYKTISSDFIEDKKHIDLSSEPLIIVCAAGTRENVLGDIIKDTAIFNAHKATPIVIADEGINSFEPYARFVFNVPKVKEHLAPIVNTLVGHLWGYYAALSINEGSRFMFKNRDELQNMLNDYTQKGLNVYEVILERNFREKIARFYKDFRKKRMNYEFPEIMGFNTASDLTLLLKYLSGRLPVSDFELDFLKKGTPLNMLDSLFECLGNSINYMARPVDAIKHQAKTVTVGTSRISDNVEGLLFEALSEHNLNISQITNTNVIVIKNLQGVISKILGIVLYKISGLNLLGEISERTRIEVIVKKGVLKDIPSRVEKDNQLKGTKRIIIREGNVFIGKGRKDGRMTLVIPVISSDTPDSAVIEYLLSLHVKFKEDKEIPLFVKIKALGGKFERIRNLTQENSVKWDDNYINQIPVDDLYGISAEKIVEKYIKSENDK